MSGYENPSPDAHEYKFQLNTPSPSETSANFEISRAAVQELADYVRELENEKLITGVRMAIFGSSVSEPARAPSDIDVFLIYESLKKPFIAPFQWRGEDGSLSEKALKLYRGISSKGRNLDLTIGEPQNDTETTYPHHVNLVKVSRQEFLTILNQESQRNRNDYLDALESYALLGCVPDPTRPEIMDLVNLMPVFAKSWEEIQSGQFAGGQEIQNYLDGPFQYLHSEWIKERIAELTNLPPREIYEKAKFLLKEIVLKIDASLQAERDKQEDKNVKGRIYEVSKKLRASFQSYIDGRNYVQTAMGNGAVLIKGENLLDQNQQPVFTRVDKEFLK